MVSYFGLIGVTWPFEAGPDRHAHHVVAGGVGPDRRADQGQGPWSEQRVEPMGGRLVEHDIGRQSNRDSRQASAAFNPCSLRIRPNSRRSGVSMVSIWTSMSMPIASASFMPISS